jgi:FSR family fosmidomycin resistance protein-like MFS transporter
MSQNMSLELNRVAQPAPAVGLAFATILAAHVAVDGLAALVPSTLGLIEVRLQMTTQQSAWLFGIGPLFSGISQPICALISDSLATRKLGVVGLALAVLGIGALGLASDFVSIGLIYFCGVIGIGMFHPIGAATIGHLWQQRRTSAVSSFFVAGMLGGVLGSLVWPRVLSLPDGFRYLPWLVAPLFILAIALQRSFSGLPPLVVRVSKHSDNKLPPVRWTLVGVLYVGAVLRFCVNTALAYLFLRWAQNGVATEHPAWSLQEVAHAAAPLVGNLNAALLVGMAVGGLSAGVLVRSGKEKWPMVLVPLGFAPVIGLFPFMPLNVGYFMAVAAGVGFAAVIPVTIALAQHSMPGRTNLASSLMMGGAWAVAMLGPTCAEFGVAHFGLQTTFLATAVTLALAGLVCLPISNEAA